MLSRPAERPLAAVSFAALSFVTLSFAPAGFAQSLPDGFALEQVVAAPFGGEPTAFAFLPDRRIVLVERNSGGVRVAAVGAPTSDPVHVIPGVSQGAERGLLGVAVDPAWPTRPYLYFYFTRTDSTSRLTMFKASGALTDSASTALTLSNEFLLLTGIPDLTESHNGGGLEFGPDGMLYLGLGEDLARCPSQDRTSLLGKLLRLDVSAMPAAGPGPPPRADLAPADNPFALAADESERLVWAWGLRNPFGFSIDPVTGDAFLGDVGATQAEEVDHIPFASGGGQNFGWPIREGLGEAPFGDSCGAANPFTDPIHAYDHDPVFPRAVIGGPLYRFPPGEDGGFPESYDGSYFFADWGGEWIRRLVPGSSGWEAASPVPGQPSSEDWAQGIVNMTQLEQGPDGALYIMRRAGTARGLYRIVRTLPTAAATATRPAVPAGLSLRADPNPAPSAGTTLTWTLPRAGRISVEIVDVGGRLVRRLHGGPAPAGPGSIRWDGRGEDGRPARAGTYFARILDASGTTAAAKIARVR